MLLVASVIARSDFGPFRSQEWSELHTSPHLRPHRPFSQQRFSYSPGSTRHGLIAGEYRLCYSTGLSFGSGEIQR
jgi:hypothetical protein